MLVPTIPIRLKCLKDWKSKTEKSKLQPQDYTRLAQMKIEDLRFRKLELNSNPVVVCEVGLHEINKKKNILVEICGISWLGGMDARSIL